MADRAAPAADVTPEEAVALLKTTPGAILIDVRTKPEWDNIGVPDAAALPTPPVFLEYLSAPTMTPNPAFAARIAEELAARGADHGTPLLFLCRSGARSQAAATMVASMGYTQCHNVLGGFEGSPGQGYAGWKQSGLPWTR